MASFAIGISPPIHSHPPENRLSASQAFKLSVLQPDLLALGLATGFVYIVRQSISDWYIPLLCLYPDALTHSLGRRFIL